VCVCVCVCVRARVCVCICVCVCVPFDSITLLHLHVHILSPVCCCCYYYYYYYYYYCQVWKDDDIFVKRFTALNKFCANLCLFTSTYLFFSAFCRPCDLVLLLFASSYHICFCFVCLLLRFCVLLLFLCFVCVFLLTLQQALVLLSLHFNKCPLGWIELNWIIVIIVVVGIKISTPVLQAVTGVIAHARLLLWAVQFTGSPQVRDMCLNQITALVVSHLCSAELTRYRARNSCTCSLPCTAARVAKYIPCLPAEHKVDAV